MKIHIKIDVIWQELSNLTPNWLLAQTPQSDAELEIYCHIKRILKMIVEK